MENITAKVSCFARAYHHKNNEVHIFDDTAAEGLLGKDYDEIAKNMTEGVKFFFPDFKGTKEEGLRLIVDRQLSPSVLGRSAYCESKLAYEKNHGCRQYVIFASGYDTFSLRNTNDSLKVFELDLPELLTDKKERMKRGEIKSKAVYVPCNLAEITWRDKLITAGYSPEQKSFGSLLGISYYLDKEKFMRLLRSINEIMAEDSAICFDYPSTEESSEAKTNQMLALEAGEGMKALYSYGEIELLLKRSGFEISEHLNDKEMTEQYFSKYNTCNPTHSIQASMGVGYILGVKK